MSPGYEAQGLTPLTADRLLQPASSTTFSEQRHLLDSNSNTPRYSGGHFPLKPQETASPDPPSACRSHPETSTSNAEAPSCSYQHLVIDRGISPPPRPDKEAILKHPPANGCVCVC